MKSYTLVQTYLSGLKRRIGLIIGILSIIAGYRLLFFGFGRIYGSVFEPVHAFHVYIAASCNPIYFSLL